MSVLLCIWFLIGFFSGNYILKSLKFKMDLLSTGMLVVYTLIGLFSTAFAFGRYMELQQEALFNESDPNKK